MRYEVDAGGRRVRIEVAPDGRMLVDGRVVPYETRETVPRRQWSLVVDGRAHEATLLAAASAPGGPARWAVDGRETVVAVQDERLAAARGDRAALHGGRHEVRAPMPGLLKTVHVRDGDLVERGDALATLEAMKMENELRSPARGRIERIAAAAGAKVESGALIAVVVDE